VRCLARLFGGTIRSFGQRISGFRVVRNEARATDEGDGQVSDQWGQPQPPQDGYGQQPADPYSGQPPMQPPMQPMQPAGPQGPYAPPQGPYTAPQGPYGQQPGPDPYGQAPMQPPQGPYGQVPQPGPYGPPQPPGPYGQPADPFGQQLITPQNPYGQPQFGQPGQPGAPGQFPGQQPYAGYPGFPGQPGQPGAPGQGAGGRKNMLIGVGVLVVIIAAAAIFFATKGSSGGGTKTQAESCTSWKSELTTMGNQDPNSTAQLISVLNTDLPSMQNIANDAQSGTFKTQMAKAVTDFTAFRSYLQANPNVDTSSDNPPAQLQSLDASLSTDVTTLDSTCGISDDSGDGGF
jgi:hypothetical protein